jgi:hypothetical protein
MKLSLELMAKAIRERLEEEVLPEPTADRDLLIQLEEELRELANELS